MSKPGDKGEQIRIKQKYADWLRNLSDERDETFLETVYHVFDMYRMFLEDTIKSGNLPPKTASTPAPQPKPKSETKPVVKDEIEPDLSDFE